MTSPLKKEGFSYTYGDYLQWPESERWELVDGVAYNMSPAPSRRHQEILGHLFNRFYNYLAGQPCRVYSAPFDVRFPLGAENDDDETRTVVQPDIVVVCDRAKLDDRGCKGTPDLIIEIVSPSSASMDFIVKRELYEKHGVKEYWTVHPADKIVMIYTLNEQGLYGKPAVYTPDDMILVGIFQNDLSIDLGTVFAEDRL